MDLSELKWRAKSAFQYADTDQVGSLTKYQYKVGMTAVFGRPPDKIEVNCVLESCGYKRITFEKFESLALKKYSSHSATISLDILFNMLDKKCNGFLTLNDLYVAGQLAQLRTSPAVWEKVFYSLDKHRKGYISLFEFIKLLNNTANGN